jgi:hypothetical protein
MRIMLATAVVVLLAGLAQADQERMRTALDELRQAKRTLEQAPENKGGHRERAIEHIDAAIGQVEQGIAFAEGK